MLHGNKVENTLIGGPAFGKIMKGDILVKVDGNPVSEDNILSELRGNDTPGSKVVMTVRRIKIDTVSPRLPSPKERSPFASPDFSFDGDDSEEIDISITRMATAEIADRRKMFDHFTYLQVINFVSDRSMRSSPYVITSQERSVTHGDHELTMKVEETIQLWTKMWLADSDRYNKTRTLLESMQTSSEGCVLELVECLNKLTLSLTSHADYFLGTSSALVKQSRDAIKMEREAVYMHLEAVQKEVESLNLNRLNLISQVLNLQEDRRSMLSRISQMVPRSELSAAQLEVAALAGDIRSLEKEAARQRATVEGLTSRLRDMEAENFGLLSQLQVRPLARRQSPICGCVWAFSARVSFAFGTSSSRPARLGIEGASGPSMPSPSKAQQPNTFDSWPCFGAPGHRSPRRAPGCEVRLARARLPLPLPARLNPVGTAQGGVGADGRAARGVPGKDAALRCGGPHRRAD
jgi:hypothetical protein